MVMATNVSVGLQNQSVALLGGVSMGQHLADICVCTHDTDVLRQGDVGRRKTRSGRWQKRRCGLSSWRGFVGCLTGLVFGRKQRSERRWELVEEGVPGRSY